MLYSMRGVIGEVGLAAIQFSSLMSAKAACKRGCERCPDNHGALTAFALARRAPTPLRIYLTYVSARISPVYS